MPEEPKSPPFHDRPDDKVAEFLVHLATDRAASNYTVRNYEQALIEFTAWHRQTRGGLSDWALLERDDFRQYLRYLGRESLGRAAIRLRFSALRSFYKFLQGSDRCGELKLSSLRRLDLIFQVHNLFTHPRVLLENG